MRLNIRDTIAGLAPKWLSNRPPLPNGRQQNAGFKVLWSAALLLDLLLEGIIEGVIATFPIASVNSGRIDSLPYIGRTRGIIQGETETNPAFAKRLAAWLDTWINAGWEYSLAREIQLYLGNDPTVTIITRGALGPSNRVWTVVAPDGSVTRTTTTWDWDSSSNPINDATPRWTDMWVIISPSEWPITGATLSSLVGLWGVPSGFGTGHQVTRVTVDTLKRLIAQWVGAHTYANQVIFSYDSSWFTPSSPSNKLPDGLWGKWYKIDGGGHCVPSHSLIHRYWEPQSHAFPF